MKKSRVFVYLVIVISAFMINFYYRPVNNKNITDKYRKSSAYVNNLYKSDEFFKNKLLDKKGKKVYEKIIKMSLNDVKKAEISCDGCDGKMHEVYCALYLDHPELISYKGISYRAEPNYLEIYNDQNLGKLQTYFGTRRIEREMDIIRRETSNMNDKEKIIYVYDYVASHNYDQIFMYSKSNQSAYSFFTKGSSVCAGFAKASQMIFQNIGIESKLVLDDDHMWNYVKYKDKWYIFDATVGTSYLDKKVDRFYDGLGETTTGLTTGYFEELYPEIEEKRLRDIFKI